MFEGLSDRLQGVFSNLRGRGKLTPAEIDDAMREIRRALLEADVDRLVVKDLAARIKERASGSEVHASLTPDQQVVKIVSEELAAMMGSTNARLVMASKPPTVILMAGLQGSGKTTCTAKLANHFRKEGRGPLLVACDVRRPAAIDQLATLGEQIGVPVYRESGQDAVAIAVRGVQEGRRTGRDVVIIDTAGRLSIDAEMMAELVQIRDEVKPTNVVLVLDSMSGQSAVEAATAFSEAVKFDGVILTKTDGDARGGAALSVRAVTGAPILFIGTGEKVDALEAFHPDRMAQRILGMGDVLTLIERAQETVDVESAQRIEKKVRTGTMNLEDFLEQMKQVRNMGPLSKVLGMMPGMGQLAKAKDLAVDDSQLDRVEAIIRSMTPGERRRPEVINGNRRKRIATGSGTSVQEVNQLLAQFSQMQKMMKQLGKVGKGRKGGRGGFPGLAP